MRLDLFIYNGNRVLYAQANNDFVGFLEFLLRSENPPSFLHKIGFTHLKTNVLSSCCCVSDDDEEMRRPIHFCCISQVLNYVSRASVSKDHYHSKYSLVVPYVIMDDLMVEEKPSMTILWNAHRKSAIMDLALVKRKLVYLGKDEVLKIVEASRNSQTVLSDVFCKGFIESSKQLVKISEGVPESSKRLVKISEGVPESSKQLVKISEGFDDSGEGFDDGDGFSKQLVKIGFDDSECSPEFSKQICVRER